MHKPEVLKEAKKLSKKEKNGKQTAAIALDMAKKMKKC